MPGNFLFQNPTLKSGQRTYRDGSAHIDQSCGLGWVMRQLDLTVRE